MSTIHDVAKLAGVSTATVSRVINSPDKVRSITRGKVQQAMEMCRYKYNALARGFVTKKSNTIGLIVPNINNPVFAESTLGIQDYASQHNIQVILGNSYYQQDLEAGLINTFLEKQVDGLIITTANPKGGQIKSLLDDQFPFVQLYSTIKKGPVSAVGIDNYKGGYEATLHLVELGHRRIGMIAGRFNVSDRSFHRWHGYKKCLRDNDISYDSSLLLQTDYALSGGRECVKQFMGLKKRPSAIFCSNDYLALGAIKGAREIGLVLPQDLSIIGFDGIQIASYVTPSLTTIQQPAYEMGKIGADVLFQQMADGNKPVQKMLDFKLITRESTVQYKVPNK
ncbi:MAG: LacI family transcriptional regulator [Desulfobacteraceae bacterium]|nr:LacI family transcriptional regulator [Desulfobacteraceae bacterium]